MRKIPGFTVLCAAGLVVLAPAVRAQRPYIGFVYPAGGQQGTTFQIRLGGQSMDQVSAILVSGTGVTVKSIECLRRLDNPDIGILTEQLKDLKSAQSATNTMMAAPMMAAETPMMAMQAAGQPTSVLGKDAATTNLIATIEKRIRDFVQNPACTAIASLALAEIEIASDAPPGEREIRLVTPRGVSNPLVFCVGQIPEYSRKPMLTATLQILGKEAGALRKRPLAEVEDRVTVPCTVNGQIASGEVNKYRFAAHQGQRLVITALGRQLIPYLADAVPGWIQPVLSLTDATGKELAYDDDYRFQPDPVIFYEVPADGEYVVAIRDALYRGREDFVYRMTIGELPFVTSIFPLGGQVGEPVTPKMNGWNLQDATLTPPDHKAGPGVDHLVANRKGLISNRVPFAWDSLPENLEAEPNNDPAHAQKVTLPVIINGRIDRPDDWDVFQFTGQSNDTVVAEVAARRLNSPLDSVLKLTDAKGKLLAFNDDNDDLADGLNTHHADSFLMAKLPAAGTYYVHIGDTARAGGEEYAYRLRISGPQPDFALRVVPSSASLRGKESTAVAVYVIRKDGFAAPIKLGLKDPPPGFSATAVTLSGTQALTRLSFKTSRVTTNDPVNLTVEGRAKIGDLEIAHVAVPAEDRMQAFLWRHLVPASDLKVLVFDRDYQPTPIHVVPARPSPLPAVAKPAVETNATQAAGGTNTTVGTGTNRMIAGASSMTKKPNFTKKQVANRLRDLKRLYEEGLLTDDFYWERVAECDAAE